MTVRIRNLSVFIVYYKFSVLILTDFSSFIYSFFFCYRMNAGTFTAIALYIPTSIRIRYNMMFFSWHIVYLSFFTFCCLSAVYTLGLDLELVVLQVFWLLEVHE